MKGLSEALSKSSVHGAPEDEMKQREFEDQINSIGSDQPVLKMEAYAAYIKWVKDAFPTNKDKALILLEVSSLVMLITSCIGCQKIN